jgi:hypothetical protein
VCCDNLVTCEEFRTLVLNGFKPKHVSLRQGRFGFCLTAMDKLAHCTGKLTSVRIEVTSCNDLIRAVDACGVVLKSLIIDDKSGCLKDLHHDQGTMRRMWARLPMLESFGCVYLSQCSCFTSQNLRSLVVSFEEADVSSNALLGESLVTSRESEN